jgi:Na+/H+ antiporter NhaD/arsenite permease-like protein
MNTTGIIIFLLTYVLISMRRLSWLRFDRPAGALLGAVACVVAGVLTPAEALAAVDGSTLLLLFGVMGMGTFLVLDGFFAGLESALVSFARTPARLLACIVWGSGLLGAFITNDAVCVLGAPLVVRLIQRQGLPRLPFLLALATAANTGSVATLVGNPQNMLCAALGQLSYREHLALLGPVAVIALVVNHALLWLCFRAHLSGRALVPAPAGGPDVEPAGQPMGQKAGQPASTPPARDALLGRRTSVTLGIILATAVAYTLGAHLAWAAVAGFVALMLVHRRDTRELWGHIDWSLLLFFTGLFVVTEAFMQSGAPAWFFGRFPLAQATDSDTGWLSLSGVFLVGSNLVSNVPFILVVRDQMATLAEPRLGWELLAMASTFAGNLTLLGSVANIIVAESARDIGGIGFFEYLRVGLPLALITTAMGTAWLLLMV